MENLHRFPSNSNKIGQGDKDKDKELPSEEGATEGATFLAHDARHVSKDCSRERINAMDKMIADAPARNTTELTAKFTALLNERVAANTPTTLEVTSGAAGISAMPSFDWTRDKTIYQRWQAWSKKARHALEVMEEDSEKAKISYFHHWIDSAGEAQIETWINNGTLL